MRFNRSPTFSEELEESTGDDDNKGRFSVPRFYVTHFTTTLFDVSFAIFSCPTFKSAANHDL